ncbi:MAG TPA: hypothetical protein DCE42_25915, partial [Myxococcales bacterium]|nr:hypothetical protein [Myxococcales bacterium]
MWMVRSVSVALLLMGFVHWGGCASIECSNELSTATNDPNGQACQKRCDCNNQSYEGYCISGKCVAVKRSTCATKGAEAVCLPDAQFAAVSGACPGQDYKQICQDEGLNDLVYGDCKCQTNKPTEPTNPVESVPDAQTQPEPSKRDRLPSDIHPPDTHKDETAPEQTHQDETPAEPGTPDETFSDASESISPDTSEPSTPDTAFPETSSDGGTPEACHCAAGQICNVALNRCECDFKACSALGRNCVGAQCAV